MNLLIEGEIELFEKVQEIITDINPDIISSVKIEDLNHENLKKPLDHFNRFAIQKSDGIADVIITIQLKNITWKYDIRKFQLIKKDITGIIIVYFSKERGNITNKIKELLLNNYIKGV